jgi:hypothetical protein
MLLDQRIWVVTGPASEAVGELIRVRRCAFEIESVALARRGLRLALRRSEPTTASSVSASFNRSAFGAARLGWLLVNNS